MARDPVCDLRTDDAKSAKDIADEVAYTSGYEGSHYFCSRLCMHLFDKDPEWHSRGSWLGGADLER